MHLTHILRALRAVTVREVGKFVQQRGRLLSALVRPLLWLVVFAAGFYNVFGVSIIPPYKTYVTYQVYIVPGLLAMILLFHGMQSSLSMVYDREMGVMRLLLTAPLPRWVLLACKLAAGAVLSVITCYVFLAVCILFDVTFEPIDWLAVLPALIVSSFMLGALWLFLSVYIRQVENFAGAMNFVMFPMFFFSSALYPLWRLREGGSELLYYVSLANPFTYAVELIRFALYGLLEPVSALVVVGATMLFFLLAVAGYDPQRGMLRRSAAGGVTSPDKRTAAQLGERLLQFGLRVHHDRAVPGDRLLDRLAGHEEEANALVAGLHRHFVAAVEDDERAVAGLLADQDLVGAVGLLGEHAEGLRGGAEVAGALEHIGESVALELDRKRLALARRHPDVEIARVGGDALDRAALAPEVAAHHPHAGAVVIDDLGNLRGLDVLVARRGHLQRGRQIGPELEAMHAALRVALRHFLVQDAAAGRHPLHVARSEIAAIAQAVAVLDIAGEHIGDGLDAAMRMPGKSGAILVRPVVAEIVQQEERIELGGVAEAESAAQVHAGSFDRGFRGDDAFDRPNGHVVCP